MDGIVDGSWCVMLYDVIQWSDKDPGVMKHWSHGHNILGMMPVRDNMMDLKARPLLGAECRVRPVPGCPALGRRILINPCDEEAHVTRCDETHSCPLLSVDTTLKLAPESDSDLKGK